MRKTGVALLLAFASLAHAASPGWPPEPLLEIHVPVPPSAFPSGGRTYLVYEVRLTNLGKAALGINRLEVRDADATQAPPIVALEGEQLDKMLQHFANPAVGDYIPDAGAGHRSVASGETAFVFLTVILESGTHVPDRLSHRLVMADSSIDGGVVRTHATKLAVLGPPLEGGPWRAFSGAGRNDSHHRRQLMVLGGNAALPSRHAIDWKRVENGSSSSGPEDENASYYSYGRPVLAVATGQVVAVTDGIPDNSPGHVGAEALKLSLATIGGNFIVLDLGGGQFAQYMHLKPGSLRVRTGQRVKRGEVIALVGNSGSSFEPHLHFHVTDSPALIAGEGLPYLIDEYQAEVDGVPQLRRRELPTKDSIVRFREAR
jgi:hypothetical protein